MTVAVLIAFLSFCTAALCLVTAILYRGGFIPVYWHSFVVFALVMLGLGIFYTALVISMLYGIDLFPTLVNYSRVLFLGFIAIVAMMAITAIFTRKWIANGME